MSEVSTARGNKDQPLVRADGTLLKRRIHDVQRFERPNIVTKNGVTAEAYRADWGVGAPAIQQILVVNLRAGAISAWHQHHRQWDHIFCVSGGLRLVIFDDRANSPTCGLVDEYLLHPARPQLIVIPPFLWHGLQNMEPARDATFVNAFDRTYQHDDPDEYRLPWNSESIPYRFSR